MKWIIFLSLIMLFLSCRRGTDDQPLNPQLKKITSIAKGSYFVYQDSLTNTVDTIYTYDTYGIGYYLDMYYDPHYVEYVRYNMQRIQTPSDSSTTYLDFYTNTDYQGLFFNCRIKNDTTNLSVEHIRVYSEPFLIIENEENIKNSYPLATHETLFLKGKSYKSVFECYSEFILNTSGGEVVQVHTFFALNEGLIKYSIRTPDTYIVKELIYSDIKRY